MIATIAISVKQQLKEVEGCKCIDRDVGLRYLGSTDGGSGK
jgi:hypothetical protein